MLSTIGERNYVLVDRFSPQYTNAPLCADGLPSYIYNHLGQAHVGDMRKLYVSPTKSVIETLAAHFNPLSAQVNYHHKAIERKLCQLIVVAVLLICAASYYMDRSVFETTTLSLLVLYISTLVLVFLGDRRARDQLAVTDFIEASYRKVVDHGYTQINHYVQSTQELNDLQNEHVETLQALLDKAQLSNQTLLEQNETLSATNNELLSSAKEYAAHLNLAMSMNTDLLGQLSEKQYTAFKKRWETQGVEFLPELLTSPTVQ